MSRKTSLTQLQLLETEDWKQHLKDYHEFMGWNDDEDVDVSTLTQQEAKNRLREDLEYIIGMNGSDLFITERNYMKLLGMEI